MHIRKLGWTGHVIKLEEEMIPKLFWMGNYTTKDQWENQEQDGRTLSNGMRYRSYEYEDGGADLVLQKNGGAFWREDRV